MVADDWKRSFRLNTLDLNPQLLAAGDQPHWMTQEPPLMHLIESVRREVSSLNVLLDAASEPVLPTDNSSLLAMLGLDQAVRPATAIAKLVFASRALGALLRFHHWAAVARMHLRPSPSIPTTG